MIVEAIEGNTPGSLTYRNLAGMYSEGLPVGTVLGIYSNVIPGGFLACDGSIYDTSIYPALYTILGDNHTPDFREKVLVGAGTSTDNSITTHDIYTVGQFKDDQTQAINDITEITNGSNDVSFTGIVVGNGEVIGSSGIRTGTTTHGKQVGITFIIKATTGVTQITDPEIYNMVIAYVDMNFIKRSDNLSNNDILSYDKANDKITHIPRPTENNQCLVSDGLNNVYSWNSTYLNSDFTAATEPTDIISTTSIGRMAEKSSSYYDYSNETTFEASLLGTEVWNEIDVSHSLITATEVIGKGVILNNSWYVKDNLEWYPITDITDGNITEGEIITDAAVIAELEGETLTDIVHNNYLHRTFYHITALSPSGFEKELIIDDTLYTITANEWKNVDVIAYGTLSYSWGVNTTTVIKYVNNLPTANIDDIIYAIPQGNKFRYYAGNKDLQTTQELGSAKKGGVFRFATKAAAEQALSISDPDNDNFIPADSIVVVDEENQTISGELIV